MSDSERSNENIAAKLRSVIFSYGRASSLPPAEKLEDEDTVDLDTHDGPVLRGVDMTIPDGSFTVIMGASGGGKSTLLRTLNGIIPDFINGSFTGDIEVLGRDVTASRVSEMAETVGMVLQDYEAQLFNTSVETEIAFGPENLAVPPVEIDERIDHAMNLAGLTDLNRRRDPASLSGGQKQRLVFAGIAAMQPELLVLDEPTSDLDPKGTHDTLQILTSLSDDADAQNGWDGPDTIVMVTHKIEEALLADQAVLLRGGQIYRQNDVREVFTDVEALQEARVAVPPLVEAFDCLGWDRDDLPLIPDEAVTHVEQSDLEWSPPAYDGERPLPGAPAGTGADSGEPLFELMDVIYEYETDHGPIQAIDGVSLTVCEGEMVAFVGHNGSGKTTLAKHFNGLHEPHEGTVTFKDRPVPDYSMAEIGREVGYVFQNPDHQIFASRVTEEVAFGPENFGLEGEELDRRVNDALRMVELDGLEDRDPFNLSKGQRQRVALAGILATQPSVIIFDEPTTGLDAAQQDRFMDLVGRLNREEDLTIVMVTHDMDKVARYAPRTVVLQDGTTAYDGPTRELFADEETLAQWDLHPPHTVECTNRLGDDDALPALSVEELVAGLGRTDTQQTRTGTNSEERTEER